MNLEYVELVFICVIFKIQALWSVCHFPKARVVIFRGQFLSIVSGIPCQLNVTNGETEVGTNGSMYLQFTVKKKL